MAPSSEADTPEPLGLPVGLDLDGVFRISTVGLLVWDRDGRLRHTNAAFVNMMQAPVTELIGRSWEDFTPPEFWPASERAVEQLKARGESEPYEKQYQRPDGSRWWGLFAARLVQAYWVEFVLDVTDRRHAELELAEVDRRKDVFLVTLGHELRNPLSALSNAIQIMRLTPRATTASIATCGPRARAPAVAAPSPCGCRCRGDRGWTRLNPPGGRAGDAGSAGPIDEPGQQQPDRDGADRAGGHRDGVLDQRRPLPVHQPVSQRQGAGQHQRQPAQRAPVDAAGASAHMRRNISSQQRRSR